jgi:hypothetical protein
MRDYIKILQRQKANLEHLLTRTGIIDRAQCDRIDVNSAQAQIVVGVRRCGKSVLCRMALRRSGVPFGYIDFDDEPLRNVSADELDDVLKAAYVVYGPFRHLFLDEVQDVEAWQLFVNRLLREGMHLLITGSNSHLLSSELATHLTGRHIPIELTPFTFEEYRRFWGRSRPVLTEEYAEARRDYLQYAQQGGFPETFGHPDVNAYYKALYDSILVRDIMQRHEVRQTSLFTNVAYTVMSNFACEMSATKLANQLQAKSVNMVQNFISYMEEAYLVETVKLYGRKAWERTRLGKGYAVDMGLANLFTGYTAGDNRRGRTLENIVFLQLRNKRRVLDFEIYYYKDRRHEIDFLCERRGRIVKLVQVAYEIADPKTRERELSALFDLGREFKCNDLLLVTDHDNEIVERDGSKVRVVDIVAWLLDSAAEKMPDDYFAKGREAAEEARKAIAERVKAKKDG